MTYRVGVVGLGSIGMSLDFDVDDPGVIASHTKAVRQHPSFSLVGATDTNEMARELFQERYAVPGFSSVIDMMSVICPEVIVIATPTDTHPEIFEEVFQFDDVALVLLEKPLSFSRLADQRMLELAADKNTHVVVNFLRRADSSYLEILSLLKSGNLRPPFQGVCWYSKGVYNSASHFLDLLSGWFGQFTLVDAGSVQRRFGNDFDAEFLIENSVASIRFISLDDRNFSHHSIEIFSANGRLTYDMAGEEIHVRYSRRDPTFEGYFSLDADPCRIRSNLERAMFSVYDDLGGYLQKGTGSLPTLSESAQTAIVLHDISERVKQSR